MSFLACCRADSFDGDYDASSSAKEKKTRIEPWLWRGGLNRFAADGRAILSVVRNRSLSTGKQKEVGEEIEKREDPKLAAQVFTFRQMAAATNNFSAQCLVGHGGFGRVYKGYIPGINQFVAVKQLDRNGLQGNREFISEVFMLSLVDHPNLVNLIGYCADGDQRILVYEFMANGSLEDHLLDPPLNQKPLDWHARMKIAEGAAKGLEYLHEYANPQVIYRDFKSSNILLDEDFYPKLSDFGHARVGPTGDKDHVSTRVMGTYGYCAPEYAMTGQLTTKSDVYSFGVVLLELISGRRVIDTNKPASEENLVTWARPLLKDRKKFKLMADPLLKGKYPQKGLYQALIVAAMCLQEEASARPLITDVVTALGYLARPEIEFANQRDTLINENEDNTEDYDTEEQEQEEENNRNKEDLSSNSLLSSGSPS